MTSTPLTAGPRLRRRSFLAMAAVAVGGTGTRGEDAEPAISGGEDRARSADAVLQSLEQFGRRRGPKRHGLTGDELTEQAIREAAAKATGLPRLAEAFLLAVGFALDPNRILLETPLLPAAIRQVYSRHRSLAGFEELRRATMYGRGDWLQHFVVSAALVALASPAIAEWMGISKEVSDSRGKSGFSFADLQADLAGIAFGRRVLDDAAYLPTLANFTVRSVLPDPTPLPEGISWTDFERKYQSTRSAAFRKELQRLRDRIAALPE